jgi:hypothetical protein
MGVGRTGHKKAEFLLVADATPALSVLAQKGHGQSVASLCTRRLAV